MQTALKADELQMNLISYHDCELGFFQLRPLLDWE